MRIFLTGASGYLGGVLTRHLANLPEVTSITGIALTQPPTALPEKMSFRSLDIRSSELTKAMSGHDVVVHAACIVLWSSKMSVRERDAINMTGVQRVAEAARESKVRHFIHMSSMAAYDPELIRGKTGVTEEFPVGDGHSPFYYWNAKAEAERIVTQAFSPSETLLTLLRPIYIVGPNNRPVVDRYRENAVNFPRRNPRRQFIQEDDISTAVVHTLRAGIEGAFNVVPDDTMRLKDVWSLAGAKTVPTVPLFLARLITWLRWRYLGSPIHSSWVADMLLDFTGSNTKLRNTGWRPQYRSADALRTAL